MTELLIKSLCELLPYKTICKDCETDFVGVLGQVDINFGIVGIKGTNTTMVGYIPYCKPYLFPLSSMTEKQYDEFTDMGYSVTERGWSMANYHQINWLNKNHFDYRGLIPMGLAIDATNNNPYK